MRLRASAPRRCVRARCGAAATAFAVAASLLALALFAAAAAASAQHDTLGGARRSGGNGGGGAGKKKAAGAPPDLYTYKVVKSYPHDAKCFTQGLVVRACGVRRAAQKTMFVPAVPGFSFVARVHAARAAAARAPARRTRPALLAPPLRHRPRAPPRPLSTPA
jgi:hypothetical protein